MTDTVKENAYPKNPDDWWKMLNDNWENIKTILKRFLTDEQFVKAEELKEKQDKNFSVFLNIAYDNAPENILKENLPGWMILCDLSDDDIVLYQINQSLEGE